jgi:hypothetical protein
LSLTMFETFPINQLLTATPANFNRNLEPKQLSLL